MICVGNVQQMLRINQNKTYMTVGCIVQYCVWTLSFRMWSCSEWWTISDGRETDSFVPLLLKDEGICWERFYGWESGYYRGEKTEWEINLNFILNRKKRLKTDQSKKFKYAIYEWITVQFSGTQFTLLIHP